MTLDELKKWNKDKMSFVKKDMDELLEYHSQAGLFENSRTYKERCQIEILADILNKHSKACKTLDELKNIISVLINSSNPL